MPHHLVTEQGGSLARELSRAGMRHGDMADVDLVGVGAYGDAEYSALAFCPSRIRSVTARQSGTPEDYRHPIPDTVSISRRGCKRLLRAIGSQQGFLALTATVHTNGSIHLHNIRVRQFKPVDRHVSVRFAGEYEEYLEHVTS